MTGFNSKREAAADKLQKPWNEDEWRRNNWRCSHGWLRGEQCEICNAAQEPVNLLEARRIAAEYGTPNSQVDDGNLYFALSKCLEHIDAQPPQREWVGLTDEEVHALWMTGEANISEEAHSVTAYEVEAKLRERNHGT